MTGGWDKIMIVYEGSHGVGLDAGSWILDAGYWMLVTGYWMLDAGCWMLDAGYKYKDSRYNTQDTRYKFIVRSQSIEGTQDTSTKTHDT